MAKKIIHCFILEIKYLFKNIFFWLIILGNYIYLLMPYLDYYKRGNMGGALTGAAFAIDSGMLFFMVLGFVLSKKEEVNSCDEVLNSIHGTYISKMISKVLIVSTIAIITTICSLLIIYIFCFISKSHGLVYLMALKYHILFWFIPFLICGILGIILGHIKSSRQAIVLIIFIWLVTSVQNEAIFRVLSGIIGIEISELGDFFRLSQTDIHTMYNSLYGVPMEIKRWLHAILILIVCIYAAFIVIYYKNNNKKYKKFIVFTLLFAIVIMTILKAYLETPLILERGNQSNSVNIYDRQHYLEKNEPSYLSADNYVINSYEIEFKTTRKLNFNVKIDATLKSDADSIIFSLYHKLKVKNIMIENNKINYTQENDQIKVNFPKTFKKGESLEIQFVYEGLSSPIYFATDQAIMLPSHFPWVPVEGSNNAMIYNDGQIYTPDLRPKNIKKYKLKCEYGNNIYTNLDKVGDNIWAGEAKGITLISGLMDETKIGNITVYYPVDKAHLQEKTAQHVEMLKEVQKRISEDLNINHKDIEVKKVFYVPINKEGPSISNLLDFDEYIIFDCIGNNDPFNNELYNMLGNLYFLIKNENTIKQNQYAVYLFMNSYDYWYSNKNQINDNQFDFWIHSSNLDENEKIIKKIIDEHMDDQIYLKSFFINFLNFINSDKKHSNETIKNYLNNIEVK